VGVVTRGALEAARQRSGQPSLEEVIDWHPAILPAALPAAAAAARLAERLGEPDFAGVLVEEDGRLRGFVPLRALFALAPVSRHANPLTGLPGPLPAEMEAGRRLRRAEPLVLLHADVDRFRAWNSCQGVAAGDDLLLRTAAILRAALDAHCAGGRVFHLGGDDFLLLVAPETAEPLALAAMHAFDALRLPPVASGPLGLSFVAVLAEPAMTYGQARRALRELRPQARAVSGSVAVLPGDRMVRPRGAAG